MALKGRRVHVESHSSDTDTPNGVFLCGFPTEVSSLPFTVNQDMGKEDEEARLFITSGAYGGTAVTLVSEIVLLAVLFTRAKKRPEVG